MASNPNDVASIIESTVKDAWPDPVQYPGTTITPPSESLWLRLDIMWGDGFEESLVHDVATDNGIVSGKKHMVVGVVNANIFGPPGIGQGDLYERAQRFRALFNGRTIDGVRFGAASGPKPVVDPAREGEWEGVNVTVGFEFDEVVEL